ncbi:NAD-dependent epimerase/dehydratase family protein [Truepera radiovictrix]|uniref:NADP oxidoreductase coenzyme F420-dependent n=1 Tax=Truepera radiovictrix (strain DSM 17093 / CIP 108686 / LMG 22925 / RQ-24) TaxID=649638 RepID=D7CW91_TRURR|nr:NAD-dependent epimerase/dehydratase family protein [Truepera radiovictrix]ADI16041.1 NADP oxidoreductase coenzyme F420-dependent [Truepera radiovictrix DSM 17093]WMT58331.1 NAD(P)-binding domain-containing protein [Truepera radiovictrix]
MRIGILGCGWVGAALGRVLVARGHAVTGTVTTPDGLAALEAAGIRAVQLVLTPALVGDPADLFEADALVLTLPPKRRADDVRTRYPAQIAEALRHTPATTHVLFTGSTSVYADGTLEARGREVREADAGGAVSASGAALLAAEALLRERRATVLRLAGLYGYDRQPGQRLAGREVTGGDARVNLVHRDDVVAVMTRVLEEGLWGETLNVCAPLHPTRRALYTRYAARSGLPPPRFVPPHAVPFKVVRSDKLAQTLGYRFIHPDPSADAP